MARAINLLPFRLSKIDAEQILRLAQHATFSILCLLLLTNELAEAGSVGGSVGKEWGMGIKRQLLASATVLTLYACGGSGGGGDGSAPPAQPNSPPTITTPAALSLVESQETVVELQATDPDSAFVPFSLSGSDAAHFDVEDNRLLAVAPLDFEAPADANGDNVYEVTVTAGGGNATTSLDISITVSDIPLDGIARISGGANPFPAGDLTGDGIDDFLIASGEPENVPPGYFDIGYIFYRNETIGESSVALDLQMLATAPNFVRGARQLRATADFAGFTHGFVAGPFGDSLEYGGLLSGKLFSGAAQPFDATMLFPDEISGAFSGPYFIDLSNDPFPAGVRSTRDHGYFQNVFVRPIDDLNGDGTSEATLEAVFDVAADSDPAIDFTVTVIDGALIRTMPVGLFPAVTDLSTQAITLAFAAANYVLPSSYGIFAFEGYGRPGTADIDGDGVDDFIRLVGLRGDQPTNPPPDMPVSAQGHEIIVISGNALMSRPHGLNDIDSFGSGELFRISVPEGFSTPQIASVGDVDNDGHADILIHILVGGPSEPAGSQYPAYLVSGAALSAVGSLSLGDFPGDGGSTFFLPNNAGFNIELLAGNLIGDGGGDIVFSLTSYIPNTSPILDVASTIILSGAIFSGFPEIIELADPTTYSISDALAKLPANSYARILSPRSERNLGGPSTDFTAAAPLFDGDGDGFQDLGLTNTITTYETPGVLPATVQYNTYVIPSGRLRAAAVSRDPIYLDREFPVLP